MDKSKRFITNIEADERPLYEEIFRQAKFPLIIKDNAIDMFGNKEPTLLAVYHKRFRRVDHGKIISALSLMMPQMRRGSGIYDD